MFKEELFDYETESENLNNLTYTDFYYRLMLLARSVFKWENLPNGIDEKWIEKFLFYEGKCMFFKDKNVGLMVSKFSDSGELNYYDEPTFLTPVATNNGSGVLQMDDIRPYKNGEECVLIRNNDIMIPTKRTIKLFALRLAEIQRTIDINIEAQQTPVLITGSSKQKLTLVNVYKKWKGHKPVIFGDNSLETDKINVLKTDAPIVFDKLQIQKHAIWNEVMTFLGINNANMDKRERLVDDEVQANNEQIELSAQCMLKAREQACKQINDMFGENIIVKLRNAAELNFEGVRGQLEND